MSQKRSSSGCDIAAFLAALRPDTLSEAERAKLVELALAILRECHAPGQTITDPRATRDYLQLWLHDRPNEMFGIVYMDNRHRVIATEELFHGSIDGASVYPRVVVQEALKYNAAAVILFHFVPRNKMRVMCPVSLCGASCRCADRTRQRRYPGHITMRSFGVTSPTPEPGWVIAAGPRRYKGFRTTRDRLIPLQRGKPGHQIGISMPRRWVGSTRRSNRWFTDLQGVRLHPHGDLRIAVGGIQADVTQPGADHVDLDTRLKQGNGSRVSEDVRRDAA